MTKIFDHRNLNHSALVIPKEQGGTEDDTYFASIGDATNKHVASLSDSDRLLWEELITLRSGNIFRSVPSYEVNDRDPFELRGKDLEEELEEVKKKAGSKLNESGLAAIKEAFENETERRDESEDVFDHAELIPYHQMEQFPGMEKHIDIPSTPRDRLIYMGNVNQRFYDSFPEGHPNAGIINQYLSMMDREEIDEGYVCWLANLLHTESCSDYIKHYLIKLAYQLVDGHGDLDEKAEEALSAIDNCWRIEYRNKAVAKAKRDSVLMLLVHKEKEWDKQAEEGFHVYASIKSFGQVLFDGFRNRMKRVHWSRYKRAKRTHAPRVIARGLDINRCSLHELETALRVGPKEAQKVWFARPFESLGQAYHRGYIGNKTFSSSEDADKIVDSLEKAFQMDLEGMSFHQLSRLRNKLTRSQRDATLKLSQREWSLTWSYYRILKDELTRKINEQRKERKESVKEV